MGKKTMVEGRKLVSLVSAHYDGNEDRFSSTLDQIISAEEKKGSRHLVDGLYRAKRSVRRTVRPSHELPGGLMHFFESGDLPGLEDMVLDEPTQEFLGKIVAEHRVRDNMLEYGLAPRRVFLFKGPPGTGKTMASKALAHELELPLGVVRLDMVIKSHLGETGGNLRKVFDVIKSTPGVYLFDEFDSLGAQRGRDDDIGEIRRIVNGLLMMMEEEAIPGSIMVMTTNMSELLDKAVHRRLDGSFHFGNILSQEMLDRLVQKVMGKYKIPGFEVHMSYRKTVIQSQSHVVKEVEQACRDEIVERSKRT
jgi:SpoVK/Ycf46/Vps4 family AAA+-type ATPase